MLNKRIWPVLLLVGLLLQACGAPPEEEPAQFVDTPPDDVVEEEEQPINCDEVAGPKVSPSPGRLLTRVEYDNTVRDLLGLDLNLSETFPPENQVDGFENNARAHIVNPLLVQEYVEASETVADVLLQDEERRGALLAVCGEEITDERACASVFIEDLAARAFRRPAYSDEKAIFMDLFELVHESKGFDEALALVIQATLQSPQFLYRLELPGAGEPLPGQPVQVTGYEMASRLSYFLWASMPDKALFDAAAAGELTTREQVEAQARRMLADPRASSSIQNFHRQWLGLDKLTSLIKDSATYPDYSEGLKDDWRVGLEAFIDHIFMDGEPTVEALLTDSTVFLTPESAPIYGVEVEAEAQALIAYEANGDQRAGLLTQPAMMAALANPDQASPIRRGVFVRERVFCQTLPDPPDDADITPPDPAPNATTRERFAEHTADEQCAGCHLMIDPIGFGFERYDGMGRWREQENGLDIDDSGEVVGVNDAGLRGTFDGAVELSHRMAGSEVVQDCLAEQWFVYANGRQANGLDSCALDDVKQAFFASGGDIRELMVQVILSDAFVYRVAQGEPQEETP